MTAARIKFGRIDRAEPLSIGGTGDMDILARVGGGEWQAVGEVEGGEFEAMFERACGKETESRLPTG